MRSFPEVVAPVPILRADSIAHNSLKILAIVGLAAIPVIVMPGVFDYFRPAKEFAFRAQAILMLFALAAAVAFAGSARLREMLRERAVVIVLAAVIVWSIISTATSTNRLLSAESLVTIFCGAVLFVAIWYVSQSLRIAFLLTLVPVVIVNATLVALQRYEIWNPFHFTVVPDIAYFATALIGNPNDVGAYHAFVALLLFGVALHTRGWQRWAAAAGIAFAVAAILVSEARTAILALTAGLVVIGAKHSWKRGAAVVLVLLAALAVATFFPIPGLTRLSQTPQMIADGQWAAMTSNRLSPFLAAAEMFLDRPVTGVGPGGYPFHEMRYRIAVEEKYGERLVPHVGGNFGETHNDHLQMLAEGGLPGYALFLAALAIVAAHGRRPSSSDDDRAQFAATIGVPLAAVAFVLCLASFPMYIAVTRHLLLTGAALIIGWRQP